MDEETYEGMPELEAVPANDSPQKNTNATSDVNPSSKHVSEESTSSGLRDSSTPPTPVDNTDVTTTDITDVNGLEPDDKAVSSKTVEKEEVWMDILGNSLLQKKVVRRGKGRSSRPTKGCQVRIESRGYVIKDGISTHDISEAFLAQQTHKFDEAGLQTEFTLGENDVIQALELCLPLMEENEVCYLKSAAKYAYGRHGRNGDIPANSSVLFVLELLSVSPSLDLDSLPLHARLAIGAKKKTRGNELYSRGEYTSAINSYNIGLKYLDEKFLSSSPHVTSLSPPPPISAEGVPDTPSSSITSSASSLGSADDMTSSIENHVTSKEGDSSNEINELVSLRCDCFNNMAAAQLKISAFKASIKSAEEVLALQPYNIKALFRMGKAFFLNGEYAEALLTYNKALKVDPKCKLVLVEKTKVLEVMKSNSMKESILYKRMFADYHTPNKPTTPWYKSTGMLVAGSASAVALLAMLAYKQGTQRGLLSWWV